MCLAPKNLKAPKITNNLDNKRIPISQKNRTIGNYPYYGANGIQGYINDYIFDGTYLLIGEDGSVINENGTAILNWTEGKIWVNNHAHILEAKDNCLLRYLYYSLQTINISKLVRGIPPKLNQQNLNKILIPIPPLHIQQQIVEILDSFSLANSGLIPLLEREIELGEKRYSYYRDKLLTFKEE